MSSACLSETLICSLFMCVFGPHAHPLTQPRLSSVYLTAFSSTSPGPNSSWVELTAVAAVCALLSAQNGSSIPVSDPIHVSIPLPSDSPLKSATSVPVWRFDERTGKEEIRLVVCPTVGPILTHTHSSEWMPKWRLKSFGFPFNRNIHYISVFSTVHGWMTK